ncbi:MAG TPA: SDR family oxidoreductase [Mycobacteriales bacterium]|jgi:NAD(P)-dependent dehydrogenase (short-subunit alcohol dehydrogenase family)|nr:SDR family oxidoreductase [Mycobacteriales bacterium]
MADLDGRVAIVTGGGGGIGSATARLLAQRGASVAVADLDAESARAVADEIAATGVPAISAQVDVASEEEVRSLVSRVREQLGPVGILHNNAALTDNHPDVVLTDIDLDYWDRAMAINVRGYVNMVKHVVPDMIEARGGVIVNMSSGAAYQGDPVRAAYGTSKAAIVGFTKYVATQFGRYGVRCIGIAPGLIATPAVARELTPQMRDLIASHHLTTEIGRPEDIAEVVAFLASDKARFITGTTIHVDGGFTAHAPTYADTMKLMGES